MEDFLSGAIRGYLDAQLTENAVFLAERLYADFPLEPHGVLLARAYHQAGHTRKAYWVLRSAKSEEGRYLLGVCCLALGPKYLKEAEAALKTEENLKSNQKQKTAAAPPANLPPEVTSACQEQTRPEPPSSTLRKVPEGAAMSFQLGEVCRKGGRPQQAILHYRQALAFDPLMWCAFQALCDLGVPISEGEDGITAASCFQHPLPESYHRPALADHSGFPPLADLGSRENERDVRLLLLSNSQSLSHGGYQMHSASDPRQSSLNLSLSSIRGNAGARALFQTPSLTIASLRQTPKPETPGLTPILSSEEISSSATPMSYSQCIQRLPGDGATTGGKSISSFKKNLSFSSPDLNNGPAPSNHEGKEKPQKILKYAEQHSPPVTRSHSKMLNSYSGPVPVPKYKSRKGKKVSFGAALPRFSLGSQMTNGMLSHTEQSADTTEGNHGSLNQLVDDPASDDDNKENPSWPQPTLREQQALSSPTSVLKLNTELVGGNGIPVVLLQLLAVLGQGYHCLTLYRCQEAELWFRRLPSAQFQTGWVQHQLGRALFEMGRYPAARSALEEMSRCDPQRLEGVELLSTTLWHLREDVALAYLAQHALEIDRLSPHSWCVVGNCFSLQREHETALKFFQRALQLAPEFSYAYTLCGHEYVANEDFDKATTSFRQALRLDHRHYTAWCGLGSIYFRQEKYDMAEYHFRKAIDIHPQNSVLLTHLALVLHAAGTSRWQEALQVLTDTAQIEPKNPQAKFQRAKILIDLERYPEALSELELLKDLVPNEQEVYCLMGRVCKRLNRISDARRYYMTAIDLNPKDANAIKAAIDRLEEPDMEEDEAF